MGQCRLVINYDCPNHMEDYVHRVGRTGRAGNKGTAYTFIGPDEAAYAQDIIKALDASGQHVPLGLRAINYQQKQKLLLGCAKTAGSGFGGKGYRFDNDEANANKQARWKVTSKEAVSDLERSYDVALTPKGVYVKKGSKPPPGERKLYIIIEGKSEMSVRRCRAELKKRIEDEVRKL